MGGQCSQMAIIFVGTLEFESCIEREIYSVVYFIFTLSGGVSVITLKIDCVVYCLKHFGKYYSNI